MRSYGRVETWEATDGEKLLKGINQSGLGYQALLNNGRKEWSTKQGNGEKITGLITSDYSHISSLSQLIKRARSAP